MKTILEKDLFVVAGLLGQEECQRFIERGEGLGFSQAAVRTSSGREMMPAVRDNDRSEFIDPDLAASLWARCLPFVPPSIEGGVAEGLDENFRFYRYDIGQRFRRHKDGAVERSHTVRSCLTCLFYLNGDFTGGETAFYSDERIDGVRREAAVVEPRTGDALFFRHEWWHEGRALSAGRKYVLRSDVFYRFPAALPDGSVGSK